MAIVPKDQFPTSDTDIENEAMKWLVQQYFDELSETETQSFFAWLDRSPQHRQIYEHMERMWAKLTEGDTLTMDAVEESANELIETLHSADKAVSADTDTDGINQNSRAIELPNVNEGNAECALNSEKSRLAMNSGIRSETPILDENENLKVSHLPIILAVLISILLVTFSILLSR